MEFPKGLIFKLPHEQAPDFVRGALSIKRDELIGWLGKQTGEWVNLDLKVSQGGKPYASVNEWEPEKKGHYEKPADEELPF